MTSPERKKTIAFFLIIVCLIFKLSIFNDYIIDFLNELNETEGNVLIISSQSDRTLTGAFKKNTSASISCCEPYIIQLIHKWYATNLYALQVCQNNNLSFGEFNAQEFKIFKISDIIYPFHYYF